jgi:hypothetical protein
MHLQTLHVFIKSPSLKIAEARMSKRVILNVFIALLTSHVGAFAQDRNEPPPLLKTDRISAVPLLSSQELFLSIGVLLFGCFVLLLEFRLLNKLATGADEVMRVLTVTMIIVISLALVSSGYGKDQITPVLGLFGTIVGYLLGASGHDRRRSKDRSDA